MKKLFGIVFLVFCIVVHAFGMKRKAEVELVNSTPLKKLKIINRDLSIYEFFSLYSNRIRYKNGSFGKDLKVVVKTNEKPCKKK